MLPAAALLKKQGANNGATTAFLISTPESGVDSIAITYALLDPLMTVARPVAAFLTAITAGITENLFHSGNDKHNIKMNLSCQVDGCCDGIDCSPDEHKRHHSFVEKLQAGLKFAVTDIWGDLAGWFFTGILLAGLITALVPSQFFVDYLGGGFSSMLIMLVLGIPLYICATASTPIAAAFILKGVSPGAALVFLLVGPATNITSLSVLFGLLGKRATAIYLLTLSVFAVVCGLILDQLYIGLEFSARAVAGQAAELIPFPGQLAGAMILLALSVRPIYAKLKDFFNKSSHYHAHTTACGCEPGSPFPIDKT